MKTIKISKAKVHNLKNISVEIPRDKLTVITGPSGSGKSSLAFDTIYAEGQRRYIESLSSYARQFLGQIDPPDVESISGLSPSIAIDQKSTTKNPRSTVGTVTEIYDYLRVLYSKTAIAHSPVTGKELSAQSAQQIVETLLKYPEKTKFQIISPIIKNQKGEHKEEILKYQTMGFSRVRVNGEIQTLSEDLKINKNKYNTIELIIDRIVMKPDIRSRLTDSIEHSLKISHGFVIVNIDDKDHFFSEKYFCEESQTGYPELEARLFSFNSPLGACPKCNGLGESKGFSEKSLIMDETLSLTKGALPLLNKNSFLLQMVKSVAKKEKVSLVTSFKEISSEFKKILFHGSDKTYTYSFESENSQFNFKKNFPGMISWLEKKYNETSSERTRESLEEFMEIEICNECNGKKLNPYALSATIEGLSIVDLSALPIDECYDFINKISFKGEKKIIAEKLLKEIKDRLTFLIDVGLSYLTLNRSAVTLSGGESQRIRLATQIGSALSGVIYVLDEPSIGLHQRDNQRLIKTLISLKELGNTVIVVEHDEETIRSADHIIDIGPGAGIHGGEIVNEGTLNSVLKKEGTLTADYLSGRYKISIPEKRRVSDNFIEIFGAKEFNLKEIDIKIPIHSLTCVTGVSGSGKSTLIHKIVTPAIKNVIDKKTSSSTNFKKIKNAHLIDSIIKLDQSPIGRTPKSNPATYTGLFDDIRKLFSSTNKAKIRGYQPGRFSFNVKGGRCESCEGNGTLKVEMHFLPDVFITCNSCHGKRYNEETLLITYRNKNISEVLNMSIEEAKSFFSNHTKISRALETLYSVGLGYMKLGQPATTLSGGEAQRLKLSRELSKRPKGHCLYILDEPTTGLHFHDIAILLKAINQLVDNGHSVIVIEHNLDVIKTADYIIDLGPEGGKFGGEVIAEGTPEEVAKFKKSHTGVFLKDVL